MRGYTCFRLAAVMAALIVAGSASAQQAGSAPETITIGEVRINLLSDGQSEGKTSLLIDPPADVLQKYAPDGTYPTAYNSFLVRTPEHTVLVDTGFGRHLFDELAKLNVAPEQIDAVLLTHMHGDHTGGLLRDGKIAFPNAKLYVTQKEYDYWAEDAPQDRRKAVDPLVPYKSVTHFIDPGEIVTNGVELLPSIRAIAAYGHTPGHTVFMIDSQDQKLLIWGDLAHAMAIQMPDPDVAITYDTDPKLAVETRKQILEHVARHNIPVAGMHIPGEGIGFVTPVLPDAGYAFTSWSQKK